MSQTPKEQKSGAFFLFFTACRPARSPLPAKRQGRGLANPNINLKTRKLSLSREKKAAEQEHAWIRTETREHGKIDG